MIDQTRINELKSQRAFFAANGLAEKAKAIDVDIEKLRREADKVEVAEHVAQAADDEIPLKVLEPEMDDSTHHGVETAEADLVGVESADASRAKKAAARKAAKG